MSNLTDKDIQALRKIARTLVAENMGDRVYDIREREGLGWEGPRVVAWGEACAELDRLHKEGKLNDE